MDKEDQKTGTELTRRGYPIYKSNPSLSDSLPVRMKPMPSKKINNAYMVAPGNGEVVAQGAFAFVEEKEVDSEQFVKVYLDGIKQYGNLTKAGALMFEFVYRELSKLKDKDMINMNYLLVSEWKPNISRATFFRGMRELLEKGFLFRSLSTDSYFVNIRFMFNGNRLVLVQSYRQKKATKLIPQ